MAEIDFSLSTNPLHTNYMRDEDGPDVKAVRQIFEHGVIARLRLISL